VLPPTSDHFTDAEHDVLLAFGCLVMDSAQAPVKGLIGLLAHHEEQNLASARKDALSALSTSFDSDCNASLDLRIKLRTMVRVWLPSVADEPLQPMVSSSILRRLPIWLSQKKGGELSALTSEKFLCPRTDSSRAGFAAHSDWDDLVRSVLGSRLLNFEAEFDKKLLTICNVEPLPTILFLHNVIVPKLNVAQFSQEASIYILKVVGELKLWKSKSEGAAAIMLALRTVPMVVVPSSSQRQLISTFTDPADKVLLPVPCE
jgi:hypothetical protein